MAQHHGPSNGHPQELLCQDDGTWSAMPPLERVACIYGTRNVIQRPRLQVVPSSGQHIPGLKDEHHVSSFEQSTDSEILEERGQPWGRNWDRWRSITLTFGERSELREKAEGVARSANAGRTVTPVTVEEVRRKPPSKFLVSSGPIVRQSADRHHRRLPSPVANLPNLFSQ